MLPIVPYELEEIKNKLKRKAIDELGLVDAEFEGSNISQLINLLAYSTLMNNTNLSYGLNEMFISQAVDRKNVIKHARQMGYTHKRNLSYQYKIKLKTKKEGEITLPKYTKFSSNGNNFVYLGEDITDTYGTYVYVKDLINEYNSDSSNLYKNLVPGDIIITEENIPLKILDKSSTGTTRLLLQTLSGDLIPQLSESLTQDVYVYDTMSSTGYRNFIKVGTVDTFLKDDATEMFKVQITLESGSTFPIFTVVEYNTKVSGNKLEVSTAHPIKHMNSISLVNPDDNTDTVIVDVSELQYFKDGEDYINNVTFPDNIASVNEIHAVDVDSGKNDGTLTNSVTYFTPYHDMIDNKFVDLEIDFNGRIMTIEAENLSVDYENNKVGIYEINTPKKSNQNNEDDHDAIDDATVTIDDNIKTIKYFVIIDDDTGERFSIDKFSFTSSTVTILDNDGEKDTQYDDGYSVEISYENVEDLLTYKITMGYSYVKDLNNFDAVVNYSYDKGTDGYLDKRFYFSDLRGEYIWNETFKSESNPHGWSGFYASDFDAETNVLYFDVSKRYDVDGNLLGYHNEYVEILDSGNEFLPALPLNIAMKTPFKKTRLFNAEVTHDIDGNPIYKAIPGTCLASVNMLNRKNELELIVKEGNMKRYIDKDDEGNALYPELVVKVNEDMAKQGHFTIYAPNIEHNGMEMFVTRIMPDGSIEYDAPWVQRDYLLAENTDTNKTAEPLLSDYETEDEYKTALIIWQRQRVEESFVAQSNLEYEDYVNIHTKYAGTGVAMTPDFTIKMNILDSKGADGKASGLIEPVDNDYFESKYYIESSLTPFVMHAEGTNLETTESIRENAPQFSNTSNRAVTKADYKTICEAQPFISSAQVWGGEEMPASLANDTAEKRYGQIYFSIIPYSKPYTFVRELNTYRLDNVGENELFFPSYYQVTGKENYTDNNVVRKDNKNVLFSVLENYKIITLQLNYTKAIYLDMKIKIDILKYKFGQTILETNEQMFQSTRSFIVKKIEQYDSTFYQSSLTRHIDGDLGDSYGLNASIKFSVDLYDSYEKPENGTFKNKTMKNLKKPDVPVVNPTYKGINSSGYNDEWVFEMPIEMPLEALFDDDFVTDAGIIQRGTMNIGNITNCNTNNFCYGNIYMELDDGTFVAHDKDGVLETHATSSSERIEICIMYETTSVQELNDGHNTYTIPVGTKFKVGSYVISRNESIIILNINTHGKNHIMNPRLFIDGNTVDPDNADAGAQNNLFVPEVKIGTKKIDGLPVDNMVKEIALPRDYFMDTVRTLSINPKNSNIGFTKNVHPRLREVTFSK